MRTKLAHLQRNRLRAAVALIVRLADSATAVPLTIVATKRADAVVLVAIERDGERCGCGARRNGLRTEQVATQRNVVRARFELEAHRIL